MNFTGRKLDIKKIEQQLCIKNLIQYMKKKISWKILQVRTPNVTSWHQNTTNYVYSFPSDITISTNGNTNNRHQLTRNAN